MFSDWNYKNIEGLSERRRCTDGEKRYIFKQFKGDAFSVPKKRNFDRRSISATTRIAQGENSDDTDNPGEVGGAGIRQN
jgi:hypothetical protein